MSTATRVGVALYSVFAGGVVGAVIGAIVGRLTENPNEFLADLDPFVAAVIGFPIGALVGLVIGVIWVSSR